METCISSTSLDRLLARDPGSRLNMPSIHVQLGMGIGANGPGMSNGASTSSSLVGALKTHSGGEIVNAAAVTTRASTAMMRPRWTDSPSGAPLGPSKDDQPLVREDVIAGFYYVGYLFL